MVDFAPTSLFKQQEEVYKLVYAPAILPRGARVDGAHSGANPNTGDHQGWHADSGQPCTSLNQAAHSK